MMFKLDDEQRQLRDSVARFVQEPFDLARWRDADAAASRWRSMADMGWMAAAVPAADGGLGLGPRETAIVMEGMGRGLVREPYWSTAVLGTELVRRAGDANQRVELLSGIADGSLRLAFALHEPGARYDWVDVRCRAERVGDGYRISGDKVAVLDAPQADKLLVLARTAGDAGERKGLTLFCIDTGAAGIVQRRWPTLDDRECADLRFDSIEVPASGRLGAEGGAADIVEPALDHALVALCAEAGGAMAGALEATIEYLKSRRQFGQPLSSFQVLRHRVADMLVATEQARSLALHAAACLDADSLLRRRMAAAAKAQVGLSGRFVGESAVQLHGGMGVTEGMAVGHYLKRLLSIDMLLGDADHHLQYIAEAA